MDPLSGFGHAETVVLKLMEKLLDRGHALYVDSFYKSVPLAKALLSPVALQLRAPPQSKRKSPCAQVIEKLH